MATRPAQQALVPGRGVLLCDAASGMTELGAILGEPTASAGGLLYTIPLTQVVVKKA